MIPSDDVLVRQVTDLNDSAAFAELVRRHQQKILLLQRRLSGERSLAEDLTQETFIRAWERLGTYNGPDSFSGWLASIGYNVFRAHWRKHRHHRNDVSTSIAEEVLPVHEDDESHADLERLLAVLSREDQAILVLTYAYGLSNTEVGGVLDMPTGTVKARIHRAKARILERFDDRPAAADPSASTPVPRSPSDPAPRKTLLGRLRSAALPGILKGAYRA